MFMGSLITVLTVAGFFGQYAWSLDIMSHFRIQYAVLEWQDQPVMVYGAHPNPPLGIRGTQQRDSELTEIRHILGRETQPLILLGDLNASPWSAPMRQIFAETDLRHGSHGHGIRPTWWFGTQLLALPYDHILVSSEWQVLTYEIGPDIGSDHFPVLADVVLE